MELTQEFTDQVMSLSTKGREELLRRLLLSLEDEVDDGSQEEIEAAWAEEIQRRIRLSEQDPCRLQDFHVAMAEIRESLKFPAANHEIANRT